MEANCDIVVLRKKLRCVVDDGSGYGEEGRRNF